jgi:hypothetical protein
MDKEEEQSREKRADEICLLLNKYGNAAKCNRTNYLKKLKECGNSLSNTIEAMLIEQGVSKEKTKETTQLIWLKSTQQFVIERMQNHISSQPTVFDLGARQVLVLTSKILQQKNLATILLDTSIDTATKRLFKINKQTNTYDFLKRTNMRLLVAEKLHLRQDPKWTHLNKEQQDKLINQEMKNGKKLQLAKDVIKVILQERVEQYDFFKQKMQHYIISINTNEKSTEEIFKEINEKLFPPHS